jgi:hypothetical protein
VEVHDKAGLIRRSTAWAAYVHAAPTAAHYQLQESIQHHAQQPEQCNMGATGTTIAATALAAYMWQPLQTNMACTPEHHTIPKTCRCSKLHTLTNM